MEADEEDQEDPHFKMFLKNLMGDGKSYVLKVYKSNGVVDFLKYEGPRDWDDDDCVRENWRKLREEIRRHKVERREGLGNVQRRANVESLKSLDGNEKRVFEGQRKDDLELKGLGRSDDKCATENSRKSRGDVRREKVRGRKCFGKVHRRGYGGSFKKISGIDKWSDDLKMTANKKRILGLHWKDDGRNLSLSGRERGNSVVEKNHRSDDEGCLKNHRNSRNVTENEKVGGVRNSHSRYNIEESKSVLLKEKRDAEFREKGVIEMVVVLILAINCSLIAL